MARTRKTARIVQRSYMPAVQTKKETNDYCRDMWPISKHSFLAQTFTKLKVIQTSTLKDLQVIKSNSEV